MPPVDPMDVLAASADLECELKQEQTLNLCALLTAQPPERVRRAAESEFRHRLHQAATRDLVGTEWLTNSNGWTRKEIANEYVPRKDASPDGIVRLYRSFPGTRDNYERRDLLRLVFKTRDKGQFDRQQVLVHPVAELFVATHFEQMYSAESDEVAKRWLASRYSLATGANFRFLLSAYHATRWHEYRDGEARVLERMKELLAATPDSELKALVADHLKDTGLLPLFIDECRRRSTIRPSHYQVWADKLPANGATNQVLQHGLESCYQRLPLTKLLMLIRPVKHNSRTWVKISQGAIAAVLGRRLGEASREQLEEIYSSVCEFRDAAVLLLAEKAEGNEARQEVLAKLLTWAMDAHWEGRNLIAFTAIGLGASAKQIEPLYVETDKRSALRAPDFRVFAAYSGLPDSSSQMLLKWISAAPYNLLRSGQKIMARRNDIPAHEYAKRVKRGDTYAREFSELYYNHPDAKPSQLISWFGWDDHHLMPSETLVGVLSRPEYAERLLPRDVVRVVELAHKGSLLYGRGSIDKFAVEYFAGHGEEIKPFFDKYREGPVYEVLTMAWKQTDEYQKEVAQRAANED